MLGTYRQKNPGRKTQVEKPRDFSWKSNGNNEKPFRNCILPLQVVLSFMFGTERLKFPYHLLHFLVDFGLLSAKRQESAILFSWFWFFFQKPFTLFSHHPNQFTLRNGKHLLHSKESCYWIWFSWSCRFWQQVPIPHGCDAFQAICPFCAQPLEGEDGFVKLIFSTDE